MDFEGRVIQYLGEVSGTSKTGNPWKKKEWVVETFGNFPKKVKVQCFGDRSDSIILEPGRDYILSVDLESREFNGRWYTDVSVFRVQERQGMQPPVGGMGQPQNFQGGYPPQAPQQPYAPNQGYGNPGAPFGGNVESSVTFEASESDEDLPF